MMPNPSDKPLAIVGMACWLPGADDLDDYWTLLSEGRCGLGELPPDRLDRELYYDPRKGVRTKTYSTLGGITSDRPFDPRSCPVPAELLAKSHRIHLKLCEVAAAACRNAGMDPFDVPLKQVGVYVGHTPPSPLCGDVIYAKLIEHTAQYLREVNEFDRLVGGQTDEVIREIVRKVRSRYLDGDRTPEMYSNSYHAAALISRAFGFDGPSMALDAACASSLRALGHGARALQSGQIDMAVVGGASVCNTDALVLFSAAQSISATGSRPFDEEADGLIAAEGYVIVLLKTLERAILDGDPVHAVIRGIGIASDGKGKSLWAPRKEGQIEAVRRAYRGDVRPDRLQYIEAHATSTQVGDATELSALSEILGEPFRGRKVPIGSAKANIGHTLESAGLASLVKTVLAMRNGLVPPQININRLNTKIDWDEAPFFVPRQAVEWESPRDGGPRGAAVNAFGIGGLNVHVVLEEFHERGVRSQGSGFSAPTTFSREPSARARTTHHSPLTTHQPEPIAIVGTGAVLPGARTVEALWDMFASGADQKREAPPDRWDPNIGYDPEAGRPWHITTRVGGFITDFEYDWKKHKVPPRQVATADPLQFMLLDAADQAFKDAGYGEMKFDKSRAGVIVGTIFGGEFSSQLQAGLHLPQFNKMLGEFLRQRGVPEDRIAQAADEFTEILLKRMPALIDETGSFTASTLASRITKTFDLMGGATAIDAGDASAFAALACSIDLLRAGDCDVMLCAAGQCAAGFTSFEAMTRSRELARDGSEVTASPFSREPTASAVPKHDSPLTTHHHALTGPFDARSTGTVPGEGVGVVILKRLSDALRDGDRVCGIIRGVAASRTDTLDESVRRAVRRSLDSAGVVPADVTVVEAAAFGVPDDDRQEAEAIAAAYGSPDRTEPVLVGAAAGQVGNLGGGSGMVSLLKAVSEVEHLQMPKTAALEEPAPWLASHGNTIRPSLERAPIPVTSEDDSVYAGVNCVSQYDLAYHVLVERPTKVPRQATPAVRRPAAVPTAQAPPSKCDWRIIRVGAASLQELQAAASELAARAGQRWQQSAPIEWDRQEPGHNGSAPPLFNSADRFRLAIVAESADDLVGKFRLASDQISRTEARPLLAEKGIFYGCPPQRPPRVAFLFPGQGSQYAGMLKSLIGECPAAAEAMREIDAVLSRMGLPTFPDLAWENGDQLGTDVWRTQLSLLAADTIVFAAARSIGLRADRVSGHSFGELAALTAAGSWSFEEAVRATAARCAAIDSCRGETGVMLSTSAPAEVVERLCRDVGGRVHISHRNSPQQTVVGGEVAAVDRLAELVKKKGFLAKVIDVPAAFHTPLMDDVKAPFGKGLEDVAIEPPMTPLLSSVTNRYVADPDEIRDNLVTQMTRPIDYVDLVTRLIAEGTTVLVEVGPKQVLTSLNRQILDQPALKGTDATLIGCDHPKRGGLQQLLYARACIETTGALDPRAEGIITRTPVGQAASLPANAVRSLRDRTSDHEVTRPLSPTSETRIGLEQRGGLNLLRLAGTPFEMGEQHGRAIAVQIRKLLRRYADLAGTKWERVYELNGEVSRPEAFFGPDELEELRGIAKGADVTLSAVIAHNLRLYRDGGGGGIHFAVTARSNSVGGLIHAVNEDLRLGLGVRDCLERCVQIRRAKDRIPNVLFGVPGQVGGLNGVNASGLAVSSAALVDVPESAGDPADHVRPGRLRTALVKNVLERAEDIDSAIEIVRESPGTSPWSLCLSHHAEDRVCYIEFNGRDIRTLPSLPAIVAANHRLMLTAPGEVPLHSEHRLNRLKELLGGETPTAVSLQTARSALRDRFEPARGREVSAATLNTVRRVDNQISIVFQPGESRVLVTPGPAARLGEDEFRELNLDELFVGRGAQPASSDVLSAAPPTSIIDEVELTHAYAEAGPSESGGGERPVCQRHVMRLVERPAPAGQADAPSFAGAVLVLGDNRLARALRMSLERHGAEVVQLSITENPDEALAALDQLWKARPAPHLFIATAYDEDAATALDAASWERRRTRGAMLPYLVCQRWYRHVSAANLLEQASLVAVTALGGDLGFSGRVRNVESGAVAGLVKGVHLELQLGQGVKSFRAKIIDSPPSAPPDQLAETACREFAIDDGELEVGCVDGKRYVVRPVPEPVASLARTDIPRGANFVITGGARGVTAEVARALGTRFGLKLHLIGSSPAPEVPDAYRDLSPEELKEVRAIVMKEALASGEKPIDAWSRFEKALEIDKNLRSFEAAGIHARYHACDVGDRAALARVLDEIRAADGPIQGIIHGAGFERACRFEKKERALVERTIAAKVDGAAALMELTRDDPVRWFAAFGSVSGRFGGVGQTDYCLANEMLAKLIDWYRTERPDCRASVFHWHAWDDVGMAVRPESKHIRKLHNIEFMPAREGTGHLIEELRAGLPEGEIVVTEVRYCREKYGIGVSQGRDDETERQRLGEKGASPSLLHSTSPGTPSVRGGAFVPRDGDRPRGAAAAPSERAALDRLPLIDAVVAHEPGRRLTAEVRLDPASDPFLIQHRFKGQPMLPAVVTLEAIAQAAALLAGDTKRVVGARNVELLNGLRFHSDQPQTARIHARFADGSEDPTGRGTTSAGEIVCDFTCDFYNRRGQLLLNDKPYMRAVIEVADALDPDPAQAAPVRRRLLHEPSEWMNCWYFEEGLVIYHGPVFRCLRQINVEGDEGWAKLVASPLEELAGPREGDTWLIPPALLDACFFGCGSYLWIRFDGTVAIPAGIDRIRLVRLPRAGEECLLHMRFRGREGTHGVFDFTVLGEDRSVLFEVQGYRNVIVAEEAAHVV